tara:strand:+ start:1172 stop:1363 length:192 start_codon:yes stop_codon:yes gene_type:complete
MIPRKTLEDAAFWAQAVCLDCGTVQPPLVEPADEHGPCLECEGDAVYAADFVLRCADVVEAEE